MAKPPLTFMDPTTVAEAKALDEEIRKDPAKKAVSDVANAAMQEIEDIYFGSGQYDPSTGTYRAKNIHSDEVIEWIYSTGVDPEVLSAKIKNMAAGQTLVIKDRSFVKTFDGKFMDSQAYINILEKTLVKAHKMNGLEVARAVSGAEQLSKLKTTPTYKLLSFLKLLP